MKKIALLLSLLLFVLPGTSFAAGTWSGAVGAQKSAEAESPAPVEEKPKPPVVKIKAGTEVLVKVMDKLKSSQLREGQKLRFLVERNVKNASGKILIEQGAFAYGTVTKAESASIFGMGGKIGLKLDNVESYSGVMVPLTGQDDSSGASNGGAVAAGAILLTPLFIFFRGANAVIQPGTIMSVYVERDTVLEGEEFEEDPVAGERFTGGTETDKTLNDMLKESEKRKKEREAADQQQ